MRLLFVVEELVRPGYSLDVLSPKGYFNPAKADANLGHGERALNNVYDVLQKSVHLTRTLRRSGLHKLLKPSDLVFSPGNPHAGVPHEVKLRNVGLTSESGREAFFGKSADPTARASRCTRRGMRLRRCSTRMTTSTVSSSRTSRDPARLAPSGS